MTSSADSSVQDYIDACLQSGEVGEEICVCTAKKAKKGLSASAFNHMVAGFSADEEQIKALRAALSPEDTTAIRFFVFAVPNHCSEQSK